MVEVKRFSKRMKNFTLIAGPCAIEDEYMGLKIAKEVKAICEELCIDYIFKASYKKANRSKNNSFTGIGDDNALQIIKSLIKNQLLYNVFSTYVLLFHLPYL